MNAIVMGATSGIGREIALQLAAKGWKVAVCGRREERLKELLSHENIITTKQIDVTKDEAPTLLLELISELGDVDLYFHSSGIGWQNPSLEAEREMKTVETNALGFTRMVTAVFNHFKTLNGKKRHIAVISSIAGTKGLGAAPAYSATKRYVNHYLECLRQLCTIKEIKNISIHDIRPGFVKTDLLGDGGTYPLQLDPKEVASQIIRGIEKNRHIITVDWRYRLLVFFWRLIPTCLWTRMKISSKE